MTLIENLLALAGLKDSHNSWIRNWGAGHDRDRDIPIERKWSIEKYQKYQIDKQPDVLLAMFLLRDRFSLEEKRNHYRFYEQRCVHGSSLSPAVHSILACEVGRYTQAYEYYLWSSRLDLDNFNNNTHEGLHISSMSGSWMNIVCGFGGLIYTGTMLEFSPILPPAWKGYCFKFQYRGRIIQASVNAEGVSLRLIAGDSVTVRVYGKQVQLTGDAVVRPLPAAYLQRPQPKAVLLSLSSAAAGIAPFLAELREGNLKTAVVNAESSMPDAQSLLRTAQQIGASPQSCVLIADSADPLNAAIAAGMRCIGIGDKTVLHQADYTLPSIKYLNLEKVRSLY